ncbi:MAG: hypothetical protein ABW110_10425 [Steroidobacteraceae bacterium]
MNRSIALLAVAALLAGCAGGYTLVKPSPVAVAQGTIKVAPSTAWNKAPRSPLDIPQEENWTQNGPLLDSITFIGGLKDGQAIAKQRTKDDQKVPVFRSDMTPQDLTSMVESFYRIKAGTSVFETVRLSPSIFLGQTAIEYDFKYVTANEVKRKGRAVIAVIDGKLYFMSLDAAALHYFDAALPQFMEMTQTASRA